MSEGDDGLKRKSYAVRTNKGALGLARFLHENMNVVYIS